MNVADAAHCVVHSYPGGSESLAPRIGMSAAVLRNKVNPNCETHHLTLAEADRITGITNDMRIVHALAAAHGHVAVHVDAEAVVGDMAVLEVIAGLWASNGALGTQVHAALADGQLTAAEMQQIRAAAYAVQAKVLGLLDRLDAMAQPGEVGNA